jgi:predicted oxidoreductase
MSILAAIVHAFSRKYFIKKLENSGKLRSFHVSNQKLSSFKKLTRLVFGRSHYI